MRSTFSLLSSNTSVPLQGMQGEMQNTAQLFQQLGALSPLLAELNQNGFKQPANLSMLLPHFLDIPLRELRFSRALDAAHIEVWQFDELEGRLHHTLPVHSTQYAHIETEYVSLGQGQLHSEGTMYNEFFHALYTYPCGSVMNIPLFFQGQTWGVLHWGRVQPENYSEKDFFVAQLLGQIFTPILVHEYKAPYPSHSEQVHEKSSTSELKHAKALLEDTKQALLESKKESVELQHAFHKLEEEKNALLARHEALQEQLDIVLTGQHMLDSGPIHEESVLEESFSEFETDESPSEYIASPPPIVSHNQIASSPSQSGLLRPSLDDLRNAFSAETEEDSQLNQRKIRDTSELLLVEVAEDSEDGEEPNKPVVLLEDVEWEHPITSPRMTIACLKEAPSDALRSFVHIAQTFDFTIAASSTLQVLTESIGMQQHKAIALTSSQYSRSSVLRHYTTQATLEQHIPIFEATDYDASELCIRMHWGSYSSPWKMDTFWHSWLRKTQRTESHNPALGISLSEDVHPHSIVHFFCGDVRLQRCEHLVDGIQVLYQSPPPLFILQIGQEQTHWQALFPELSRSARTLAIPIILLIDQPLSKELQAMLKPFVSLQLFLTP